jgi:hypothetical protein
LDFFPRTHTVFGSSRGKFKYGLGVNIAAEGYLCNSIYYSILIGKNFISDLEECRDKDMLNPSQLINVRTDTIRYYQGQGIKLDYFYLQKGWNIGSGWYSRAAFGYFEPAYGGLAIEALYAPKNSSWAVGLEYAELRKRKYKGVGLTKYVRCLKGWDPTYTKFYPRQFFADFYYHPEGAPLDIRLSAGQFLAKDLGIRAEVFKRFSNGFTLSLWSTWTNQYDAINGDRYYDKGVSLSLPIDLLLAESCRRVWKHTLSPWLRDVGARASTGKGLYSTIHLERD